MKFPLQIRDGETHTVRAFRAKPLTSEELPPGLAEYAERDESFRAVVEVAPEAVPPFIDVTFDVDGAHINEAEGFLAFRPSAFKEGCGSTVIEVVP
jgi:hypothetical protein